MPSVTLMRKTHFSAAHRLHSHLLTSEENQQIFGPCNNANGHGHNYELEVYVKGPINPELGYVINLVDLNHIIDTAILKEVDHKHLNLDVPWLEGINPTIENLVVAFWKRLEEHLPKGLLHDIKLWETPRNMAEYHGD